MKFIKTKFAGVYIVELEKKEDERGFLARWWDKDEFKKYGVDLKMTQGYISYSKNKGTLRGFHYLGGPKKEIKITKVLRGSVYEVVLDLRKNSSTYKKWQGFKFVADDYKMLLVPKNFAHAILTLQVDTEFMTLYSPNYDPKHEKGIRFSDSQFKMKWPVKVKYISEKDQSWPNFKG